MADEPEITEDDLIRVDKHRRLILLGYRHCDADELAAIGADVARIEQLVKDGCDLPTAARIVA